MTVLSWANATLAFLLELVALGVLAVWGWRNGDGAVLRVLLAVGIPLLAALLWGLFAAPHASVPTAWGRPAVQLLVLGGAALALATLTRPALGLGLAAVVAANLALAATLPPVAVTGV